MTIRQVTSLASKEAACLIRGKFTGTIVCVFQRDFNLSGIEYDYIAYTMNEGVCTGRVKNPIVRAD